MFCALFSPGYRLAAALRYREESLGSRPAAVVDSEGSATVVVERTPAAASAGVEEGMTPTQALARCLDLQILSRAPAAERSLAETLLGVACGASAYVEATAPNLCTLDLQGCRRAEGMDWAAWGEALRARVAALGLGARLGIAGNPDLALLAAQCADAENPVRAVADAPRFLAGLPLRLLSPSAPVAAVLEGWGVTTLGELTRLKRVQIAARLGPEGARLWDRACGRSTRLLRLVRAPERYEEAFDFEQALDTAQPLLFLLRRFVDQLAARLDDAGLVAGEMRLALPLSNGARYERLFQIPSPTANADVLFRVLDTHFESLRLEQTLVGVRLTVEPVRPEHRQFRLFENALRDPNRFAETLARISAVVGSGNVGVPELKSTHKPDQFTLAMPDFGAPPAPALPGGPAAVGLPLRRFRPPLPAQVHEAAEEARRPRYVVSEQAHGRIVDVLGPYRLSGDWWETGWSAEEWDVQMEDGGLFRLSRQGAFWTVEGCYDV
ncbi:MAG: DNA polymerase Y family protein [Chthoniobacteraceae bacterium]|nr:DNA polymerase Y family protein [Chthoniobacteraceae bacterium]